MANLTRREIAAAFKNAFGRSATRGEYRYWLNKPSEGLRDALRKDPNTGGVYATYRDSVSGGPEGDAPFTPPEQQVPSYDQFLKDAGSSYANAYSQESLNREFDPYYNQLLGAEDYQRGLAEQDLSKQQGLVKDTSSLTGFGQNFSNRGLFGSSIYQQAVNKELDQLSQGFNRQFGTDQYTPYSQRKAAIEQERLAAKARAGLSRQQQAFSSYQQQYYPNVSFGA